MEQVAITWHEGRQQCAWVVITEQGEQSGWSETKQEARDQIDQALNPRPIKEKRILRKYRSP